MTADYIIKLLGSCESINGFDISADYLARGDRAICVKPCGGDKIERSYYDGSSVMSNELELIIRLGSNHDKSILNRRLLEDAEAELEEFGSSRLFPLPEGGELPLKLKVCEKAEVISDDIHSVRYRMKLKITYLKEKRG